MINVFISYRRVDGSEQAKFIRNKIKDFNFQEELKHYQQVVHVFLDKAFEKPTEDFWKTKIFPELEKADFLVILITASLKQQEDNQDNWTIREINDFISLKQSQDNQPEKYIIPVVCPGSSHEDIPKCLKQLSENWDWVDITNYSWKRLIPLATREHVDDAIYKITASIFDVKKTDLEFHSRQIQRQRTKSLVSVSFALLFLTIILSVLSVSVWIQRTEAIAQKRRAQIGEANALANHSHDATKANSPALGTSIALLALPNDPEDRPYVWQAGVALGLAYQNLRQFQLLSFDQPMRGVAWDETAGKIYAASMTGDIFIESIAAKGPYKAVNSLDLSGKKASDGNPAMVLNLVHTPDKNDLIILDSLNGLTTYNIETNSFTQIPTEVESPSCLTLSDSGEKILLTSESGTVEMLDRATFSSEKLLDLSKKLFPWCIHLDEKSGHMLVAGSNLDFDSGELAVVDTEGNVLASELFANEAFLTWVEINSEHDLVAVVSIEGHVYTYKLSEVVQGTFKPQIKEYNQGKVLDKAFFSPDGNYLLVNNNGAGLMLHDTNTSARLGEITENSSMVFNISPQKNGFATASNDGTVRLFHYETNGAVKSLRGQIGKAASNAIHADRGLITVGTMDGQLLVWSIDEGKLLSQWKPKPDARKSYIRDIAFDDSGHFVLAGSDKGELLLWEFEQSNTTPKILRKNVSGYIGIEALGDQVFIVAASDGLIEILDLADPAKAIFDLFVPKGQLAYISAIEASEHYLLVVGKTEASLWDIQTRSKIKAVTLPPTSSSSANLLGGIISPNENILAVATRDNVAHVYSIPDLSLIEKLPHSVTNATQLEFDKTGRWLAAFDYRKLYIHDHLQLRKFELKGIDQLLDVEFVSHGNTARLAAVTSEGELRVWNLISEEPDLYYKNPGATGDTFFEIEAVPGNQILLTGSQNPKLFPVLPGFPKLVELAEKQISEEDANVIRKQAGDRYYLPIGDYLAH